MVSLRAGVVLGAGSTSFEVIRQLSTLLLVQPVPSWLEHKVQPIAVSDVLRAMVEAFADDQLIGAVDIGGPNVLPYARLLAECSRAAGLLRLRVPDLPLPSALVGLGTAALVAAPVLDGRGAHREPARRHGLPPGGDLGACRTAGRCSASARRCPAASGPDGSSPEAALPSDADWTRMRAPLLDELHAPATVRAGASLALRRVRSLLSLV